MITYEPLHKLMASREIGWTDLRSLLPCSSSTAAKLHRHIPVSLDVVDRLCKCLDCRVEDVLVYVE